MMDDRFLDRGWDALSHFDHIFGEGAVFRPHGPFLYNALRIS